MNEETKKSPCDIPGACAKMNRKCDVCAPAAPVAPADLVEAVDRVLAEAPCECGERLRFDRGEHLSGCYLFDLNEARNRVAAPAAPVAQVPALSFAVFDEFGKGADDRVQDYAARLVDEARALHAAPVAQPLTDEQIRDEYLRPCYASHVMYDWFEAGARFAERKHGIGQGGAA